MTHVVVNGNAYSDDGSSSRDMRQGGFRNWLLPMISDQMIEVRVAPEKSAAAAAAAQDAQHAAEVASDSAMGYRNETRQARDVTLQARADAQGFASQAGQHASDAGAAAGTAVQAAETATAVGPGWSPVLALVLDGARIVQRVADFVGGVGNKPAVYIGKYVGATGYVTDLADAVDVRGRTGDAGAVVVRQAPAAGIVSAPAGERHDDTMLLAGYGMYVWDAASVLAADRETVIEGTDVAGPGRWLLQLPTWEFVWAHLAPALDSLRADAERLRPYCVSAVLDYPSIAAGGSASLTVTLNGVQPGAPIALVPGGTACGLDR